MYRLASLVLIFLLILPLGLCAETQQPTESDSSAEAMPADAKVFRLPEGLAQGPGTLTDANFLIGSWKGEAFGKPFEAHWSPPSAGSMLGTFKLLEDDGDATRFFEILMLDERDGSLNLRVKHFQPDFTAWEDKDEHTNFRLMRVDDDALHFSGLSFYRITDDEMHGYILMRRGDRTTEEKLVYHRVTD